jgi:DNA-binding transcriptional MerR regulator
VNWQSETEQPNEPERSEAPEASGEMSIGAVCDATGLSARTVRYYEELGLLPGVRRRAAGRRVYGDDELERLSFIQRLKTLGLSLSEVKELNSLYALAGSTHAMLERLDGLLGAHQKELDGRIAELMGLRDEMSKYRDHIASRLEQQDVPATPED